MTSLFAPAALVGLLFLTVAAFAASEEAVERNAAGARLAEQGEMNGAIGEFQKAIRLDGNYFPPRLNLAYAYETANRIDEAIDAYREAIAAQPQNFFAHNNLGVLYDKKGWYDAAMSEFETALQIEPGNAMARKNLETARKNRSVIKDREAQIFRSEKEAEAKPNDPRAAYDAARLHAHYGNKDLALEWLSRALKRGYKDLAYVRADPAFGRLREDRDFERLLRK